MNEHIDSRMLFSYFVGVVGAKTAVHGAVAFPEYDLRFLKLLFSVAAELFIRIPYRHLVERDPARVGRVAPEVLVGEEEDLFALTVSPFEDPLRVRRGANCTAALSAECFYRSGRIHIGYRQDRIYADFGQFFPSGFDLIDSGHIGHRTTGGQIGQDHFLIRPAQDVGGLGHEVNPAEYYEFRLPLGGHLRKLERVSAQIRMTNHVVALIVMTENNESCSQLFSGLFDPARKFRL